MGPARIYRPRGHITNTNKNLYWTESQLRLKSMQAHQRCRDPTAADFSTKASPLHQKSKSYDLNNQQSQFKQEIYLNWNLGSAEDKLLLLLFFKSLQLNC